MTSWYPLMQVLNTTSPLCACSSGAPNSTPSYVAPDSSARRPLTSAIDDTLRVDRYANRILMDDTPTREGEQHGAAQRCAQQWRVARPRVERRLAHRPLGVRIEERARRRLAYSQSWLRDTGCRTENPMWPNGESLDERREPLPSHPADGDAGCKRSFESDHPRSRV